MSRVTRSGGIVAAAVWDYGEGMEMLRASWDEAVALDSAIAARDERTMPLCTRGELAAPGPDCVAGGPATFHLHFSASKRGRGASRSTRLQCS